MSKKLKAEIARFIIYKFLFSDELFSMAFKEFIHPKSIVVESEDDEISNKLVWSGEFGLKETKLRAVLANLALSDGEEDLVMIFQVDELSPYLITYAEDVSAIYFNHNNMWLECSVDMACRLIIGLESFAGFFPKLKFSENNDLFTMLNDHVNPYEKKNT